MPLAFTQDFLVGIFYRTNLFVFQAHLQELMMNLTEDCTQCYSNNVSEVGSLQAQHDDDEAVTAAASDRITVLNNTNITNVAIQVNTSLCTL